MNAIFAQPAPEEGESAPDASDFKSASSFAEAVAKAFSSSNN